MSPIFIIALISKGHKTDWKICIGYQCHQI
jgi:hypothetical protein